MPQLGYQRLGDGPPLLILHGLFGSGRNWQSHARRLAEFFDVVTIDLRNHGQSFHADEMDYSLMAADVERLIGDLDLGACNLLGHSMGGKVAMALALESPQTVARLVVADIAPVIYRHDHDELVDAALGLAVDAIGARADADRELQSAVPDPGLRAFLLQNLVRDGDNWRWRVNWRAIQRNMRQLTGFVELADDWHVDVPALFIRGAKSDYVGAAEIEQIERHFGNAEIATVDDAGHWLHAERPQAFIERVLEFLLPPAERGGD
ncbi:MAG TPA: alpha/beta fold hydrolase [Gammaproteobacteria bacterium]|jgi:pimeloyl-ACP methyl ester carboxylesterase